MKYMVSNLYNMKRFSSETCKSLSVIVAGTKFFIFTTIAYIDIMEPISQKNTMNNYRYKCRIKINMYYFN